jgi:hypothetical protein
MNSQLIIPKVVKRIDKIDPVRRYPFSAEVKTNKENIFKDLNISNIDFESDSEDIKSEIFSILHRPNRCRRDIPPRNSNPFIKNIKEESVYV